MGAPNADEPVLPDPDVEEGIKYWASQPASYDGVLGGFGNGTLPRVDALGTRQFLMYLLPELCTVPSAIRPLAAPSPTSTPSTPPRRTRALDVGAGVGRVTSDVLLHLFADVLLVEPCEPFIVEALRRGRASEAASAEANASIALDENPMAVPWKGVRERRTSVTFVQATLQDFDPARPAGRVLGRVGYGGDGAGKVDVDVDVGDMDSGFDVVMCQWCLGAMSDPDLVAFFRRSRAALRDPKRGLIVVKENLCSEDGGPRAVFDESDSSLTRSDLAWKEAFAEAGLKIIHEQIQLGFPEGLYDVKMYALR